MPEAVRSVMLAGNGLLYWPGGEERVHYRVNVGFDGVINGIHVGPPVPDVLLRPCRHGDLFLHMPEGRRLALNVAPNGYLSPDGPMERRIDGQDWWVDTTPGLLLETRDRFTLVMKAGPLLIFESHSTPEEAGGAYRDWEHVEFAEIRPPFGRPIRLK